MEFIDSANQLGDIWSRTRGWHHIPFPAVPAKFVALCVNNKVRGMTDGEVEDRLKELGFSPLYCYLGLNNPSDKQDPTQLLFFLRKFNRDDEECDRAIARLIEGGIPARAIIVLTHKIYCAAVGLPCDRADNKRDD